MERGRSAKTAWVRARTDLLELVDERGEMLIAIVYDRAWPGNEHRAYQRLFAAAAARGFLAVVFGDPAGEGRDRPGDGRPA